MGPQAAVPRALLSTGTLPVHTGPAPAPGAGQWRPGRGQGSPQTCSQHSGPTKPEAGGRSTPGAALSRSRQTGPSPVLHDTRDPGKGHTCFPDPCWGS